MLENNRMTADTRGWFKRQECAWLGGWGWLAVLRERRPKGGICRSWLVGPTWGLGGAQSLSSETGQGVSARDPRPLSQK